MTLTADFESCNFLWQCAGFCRHRTHQVSLCKI